MKKYLVLLVLVLACACVVPELASEIATIAANQSDPPVLSVSVAPSALARGTEAIIHVRVENPGESDWETRNLLVGYGEDDFESLILIEEIPVTLPAGEAFEQDVSWTVDFQPEPDARYQIKLVLTLPDGMHLGEAAVPVEFVQLGLSVSLDPAEPPMGSQVMITVQLTNPSGADLEGVTLIVGHGPVVDTVLYPIEEIPVSVKAGETFSQEIPWVVDYSLSDGEYQVMVLLLSPENILISSAEAPVGPAAP